MDNKLTSITLTLGTAATTGQALAGFFIVNGQTIMVCCAISTAMITTIVGVFTILSKRKRNKESDSVIKVNNLSEKLLDLQIEIDRKRLEKETYELQYVRRCGDVIMPDVERIEKENEDNQNK